MAIWKPSSTTVGLQEVVGRRILGDKVFDDELGQGAARRLRVDHFVDSRLAENLSVDRLGASGNLNRKVQRHVADIAVQEAETQMGSFRGWGALRVSTLRKPNPGLDVLATPTPTNAYHADICRDGFRTRQTAYALAFMLRDLTQNDFGFVAHGKRSLLRKLLSALARCLL